MRRRTSALLASGLLATTLLAGCSSADQNGTTMPGITPLPVSFELHEGAAPFRLTESTRIIVEGDAATAPELLAERLRAATGWEVPVVAAGSSAGSSASDIMIVVAPGEAPDGAAEGYTLEVDSDGARIGADTPAGAFWGTQSLRQLLPAAIERADATEPDGGWAAAAASVTDAPRFAYRAAMLDVARHFFPVEDVERYLDQLALLKLNVLHLHLTDDQGWRLEIPGRPELTGIGASTSVGGDGGGFYTADDYRRIVAYAADRQITVVPEIDLPGHTNAALSATPELNCDGVAPAPYEGVEVGFSSLCASPERAEVTDRFLADVLGTVASLTPGPYLHVGGDESLATSEADYLDLVRRITAAAAATGKTVIAWHEAGASTDLPEGTIGQYWNFVEPANDDEVANAVSFVEQGGALVMSPADVAYLDMKYVDDPQTALGRTVGLQWAKGPTTLDEAYAWEPTEILPGVGETQVLGIEAPLWTETVSRIEEVEFLVFPRVTAIAEIAWSPRPDGGERDHDAFFERVARLGERWDVLGVTYYPVRGVPWTR
ncbi:family 20 glycosylhydrolase [Agromyces intestinalis]|uniref:beta-N-acetylhexosaminidase n=1 Tax=Agromyces intestinalis TaxID=2592652 RepID=A0A5C1YI39_9MICO|nr:beta-N-acetylhexosaminidase [Agromyces intestinalis]QEO15268.1 family 20 glycosylhydrolase [Agromyces intestinalis]